MATVVQTAYAYTAYSETTLNAVFSSNVTSGNTVLAVASGISGNTVTSATFNSLSMTNDLDTNANGVKFFRYDNAGVNDTVALTKPNGGAILWALEVSGLDTTGQPDETNVWAATSEGFGTSHSEAVTPAEASTFGLCIAKGSTGSTTMSASGSSVVDQSADDDTFGIIYEDGLAITTDTIAWTTSASNDFSVASVVYGPAAAGGVGRLINGGLVR